MRSVKCRSDAGPPSADESQPLFGRFGHSCGKVSDIYGGAALHGRNTPVNGHSERRPNGADDLVSADPFPHLTVSFTYSNRQQVAHAFPVIATVKRRLLPYIRPSRAALSNWLLALVKFARRRLIYPRGLSFRMPDSVIRFVSSAVRPLRHHWE